MSKNKATTAPWYNPATGQVEHISICPCCTRPKWSGLMAHGYCSDECKDLEESCQAHTDMLLNKRGTV